MSYTLVVELPERVQAAFDAVVREEGRSVNEIVTAAIENYVFIRTFRRLREQMLDEAQQQYTDDMIFEDVS